MSSMDNKMDDFGEIVIEYYDDNEKKFLELENAIKQLNKFYMHSTDRGRKLYQYDKTHQTEYQENMMIVSRGFAFIFPVLRDLNDIFRSSQEKIDDAVQNIESKGKESPTPYLPNNPVIVNTASQKPGIISKFTNFFSGKKVEDLPMELKDSWLMSKDIQLEIMNKRQLLKQIIQWHEGGVVQAQFFDDGMDEILTEEKGVWLENIMPDLLMVADHGLALAKRQKIDTIERMYGVTLQTHTAETQMAMFAGGASPSK